MKVLHSKKVDRRQKFHAAEGNREGVAAG